MNTSSETMSGKSLLEEISAHGVFSGLERRYIELLADAAMFKHFEADEPIFVEGDPANRFYLILNGEVSLESRVADEPHVSVQKIGADDVLGWSWLFPPYYWHFDARATRPTDAIFFYGTWLRESCERDPKFGYEMLKRSVAIIIRRLDASRRQLVAAAKGRLERTTNFFPASDTRPAAEESIHPFLDQFPAKYRDQLLKNAQRVSFLSEQIITREGEPANRFYLLESGRVALELSVNGDAVKVQTIGAEDVLGWSWLFPPFAWHFQSRAVEPTFAIACDGGHLLVHSEEDPEFGYALMKRVALVVIHQLQATRKRLAQFESV